MQNGENESVTVHKNNLFAYQKYCTTIEIRGRTNAHLLIKNIQEPLEQ